MIVGEISCNHSGDIQKAFALISAAKWAGADMVKAQYFTPEQMTLDSHRDRFLITKGSWLGQSLFELYEKTQTPKEWIPKLADFAHTLEMKFACSVYHPDAVKYVAKYVDALKVASFEVKYMDLLEKVAAADKPTLISTGAADLADIDRVMALFKGKKIILLKCTSAYPARLDQMNLATIPDMIQRFGCPVGLSDHTQGCLAAVLSVALGGSVVEKHIKMDDDCPDAAFSETPGDFKLMVGAIRQTEQAMGKISYEPTTTEYVRKLVGDKWVRTVT
jgi:sialic acid synthase SpsE